ncbi:putative transcriptional regulator, contains HTH domain [Halapricum desulfuricans]|uniref:Putative transcriptional regulator, contains HTH domain n=1 Tax=Halapricum desulfuricans TaxID=2841257 RepID=A0A897NJR1_9EURY|nr:helix-turn-helix domain-containing protein [Halapricum desulfuricans]QSG11685.1 putative transcriptional regulator, contains HTH domain [Halapricum desulfuricans]
MAPERERLEATDRGRIPLSDVLEVFEQREDRARPLTADDIMEAVDCSRRTAHNKLNELVERGVLRTRKVGSRSRVWWVPIEEQPDDGPEGPRIEELVTQVDLPGTGTTLETRQQALVAAYQYLREHPEAKKSDFLTDVYPEHPAEFETAEGWWNALQPALAELPGVDPPEERGHIWHFLGG